MMEIAQRQQSLINLNVCIVLSYCFVNEGQYWYKLKNGEYNTTLELKAGGLTYTNSLIRYLTLF